LRKEMQNILDEMQSDIENELEKVSLERLADINPDLLANIKRAATEDGTAGSGNERSGADKSGGTQKESNTIAYLPPFLSEIRSEGAIAASNEWNDFLTARNGKQINLYHETESVISTLQTMVAKGTSSDDSTDPVVYTQKDALKMTDYFATCLAVRRLLSATLGNQGTADQQFNGYASTLGGNASGASAKSNASADHNGHNTHRRRVSVVKASEFTNEGIKQRMPGAISLLYEIGLPFQSAADGRRFATQALLSNHLDALFKRNQLRKAMAATEERGWYVSDNVWTNEETGVDLVLATLQQESTASKAREGDVFATMSNNTVPADENRDCCVICGIHFKMVFDNDDGVYKYSNCVELAVMNDDAAENESDLQLLHATCWNGLGQPSVLTYDQTLTETIRH
jgi:pre-mRNA cleavage complex 2 protein Pcf11